MKKSSPTLRCDVCNEQFVLRDDDIRVSLVDCCGTLLHLKYFVCPACHQVYRIQLSDERSFELAAEAGEAYRRARKVAKGGPRGANKSVAARLYESANAKAERYRRHSAALLEWYPGAFVFEAQPNGEYKIVYRP